MWATLVPKLNERKTNKQTETSISCKGFIEHILVLPVENNPYIIWFILPERPILTSYPHIRKLFKSYFNAFSNRSETHSTKYLIKVSCLTRGTILTRELNMCNSRHFIEFILLYRTTTPTHVSFSSYWMILFAMNQPPPIFCNPFITILVNTKIYQCPKVCKCPHSKTNQPYLQPVLLLLQVLHQVLWSAPSSSKLWSKTTYLKSMNSTLQSVSI